MENHKPQIAGFTLLETLVALSVLTFSVIGPLALAAYTIRSVGYSQRQLTAFFLAQEVMEYVRNRRDNNKLVNDYWLKDLAPSGPGQGLCRNPASSGCYIDARLPDSDAASIRMCTPNCPNLRYNSATGLYGYDSGDPEVIFNRSVLLTRISDYEERIRVSVSWQERGIAKSLTIEENIFDW